MLDTAIVGGGVCGLVLARGLAEDGREFALFEARGRLGGRVLTAHSALGSVDVGASWFWPKSQPLLRGLLDELQLESFEQPDGNALTLDEPTQAATFAPAAVVHEGARRLVAGMGGLIDALAAHLPGSRLHLNQVLTAVIRHDRHVELRFRHGEEWLSVAARRVVLAVPPRVLAEGVRFEPELPAPVRATLEALPTWMAAQAKAVIRYEHASWHDAGCCGNAFVRHEQAVFREIFDAGDTGGAHAALGGFLALSPELRRKFHTGLPMLMESQMSQVFATPLGSCGITYRDWANEPHTCSARDVADFGTAPAPCEGGSMLRLGLWEQRLHFGSTETAERTAGRLEGALEAAERLRRELGSAVLSPTVPTGLTRRVPGESQGNARCFEEFALWVRSQQRPAFDAYRRHINRSLAIQQREQLTQRAMLAAMEQVFADALLRLDALPFDMRDVATERGRCALMPPVQAAFQGFIQTLLDDLSGFNRASCALANFPQEHRLSKEYEYAILRDIGAAWREFLLGANALLLAKRPVAPQRQAAADRALGAAS